MSDDDQIPPGFGEKLFRHFWGGAALSVACTFGDNTTISEDLPIGEWRTIILHDTFDERLLASKIASTDTITSARALLVFECAGRFPTNVESISWDLFPEDSGGDPLAMTLYLMPSDAKDHFVFVLAAVDDGDTVEAAIKIDDERPWLVPMYMKKGYPIPLPELSLPVGAPMVEAMRVGGRLAVRVSHDERTQTYVFKLGKFSEAYDWMVRSCPIGSPWDRLKPRANQPDSTEESTHERRTG